MIASLPRLDHVRVLNLPHYHEENGSLVVVEAQTHVPFVIARVFVVQARAHAIRGQHAHRACTQVMVCSRGAVEVLCDDGGEQRTHLLDRPNVGLLVPPAIWAQQIYHEPGSVLTVFCDRRYEPEDYIRDYAEFLQFRYQGGQ